MGTLLSPTLQAEDNLNVSLSTGLQSVNTRAPGMIFSEGESLRNTLVINKGNLTGIIWSDYDTKKGQVNEVDFIGCYFSKLSENLSSNTCVEHYTYPKLGYDSDTLLTNSLNYKFDNDIDFTLNTKHHFENDSVESGQLYQVGVGKNFSLGDVNLRASGEIGYCDNFFGCDGLTVGRVELSASKDLTDKLSASLSFQRQFSLNDNFETTNVVGANLIYKF